MQAVITLLWLGILGLLSVLSFVMLTADLRTCVRKAGELRRKHDAEWRELTMRLYGRPLPRPRTEEELVALILRLHG